MTCAHGVINKVVMSRDRSPASKKFSKRDEKEQEVNESFQDLKYQHASDYSGPQLQLCARMIANGLHEDLDNPPHVSMIPGTAPKQPKQDSLSEALTSVAQNDQCTFN